MNKSVIVGIVAVIVLGVGGFLAFHKSSAKTSVASNTNSTTPASNSTTASSSPVKSSAATITYSDNGFSPSTLTVKAGTVVTIKNTSSSDLQFASDPHPTHTDDPELNIGDVAAGQSVTFTPTTTGTHGYHNHLDASQTGTLIVQ